MNTRKPSCKPLIIAGSGRSGTTWVLDEIGTENSMQRVFEPLHSSVGKEACKYANAYMTAADRDPNLQAFISKILSGRCRTLWTKYRIVPRRLIPAPGYFVSYKSMKEFYRRYRSLLQSMKAYHSNTTGQRVVAKFIRANLLVDWLVAHVDCDVLFVMRHPGAVVESKHRLDTVSKESASLYGNNDWDPFPVLKGYCSEARLRKDVIDQYMPNMQVSKMSAIEAQTVVWCIENAPLLHRSEEPNFYLSCYEWLIDDASGEWGRLGERFAIQQPNVSNALRVPSQQASPDFKATIGTQRKLSRWQARLSDEEKTSMQAILDRFKVQLYRMDSALPVIQPPLKM